MKNLSIAHTLSNKCTKNLCKRTVLLQLIIKNVVTFFWNTVYVAASAGVTVLPAFKRILNNTPLLTNRKKCSNSNHMLHRLLVLPPPAAASQNYNLRPRLHNLQLPQHSSHLMGLYLCYTLIILNRLAFRTRRRVVIDRSETV